MKAGTASASRIMIIDDQDRYTQLIRTYLSEFEIISPSHPDTPGTEPLYFEDSIADWKFLDLHGPDVIDAILLDVHFDIPESRLLPLPGTSSPDRTRRYQGIAILRKIRKKYSMLPVILMTSYDDIGFLDTGENIRVDGLTTFLDDERLDVESLRMQLISAIRKKRDPIQEGEILWGTDPVNRDVRRRLSILARGSLPLVIEGETGTGKSFLARHYIYPLSRRAGPFFSLDLSSIPESLVPSHLFGAVRGAYTGSVTDRQGIFQAAHGGLLFIDEIQNVSPEVQRQLLTVLEDQVIRPLGSTKDIPVNVKLVVATNTSLRDAVSAGRFRSDLYMRLNPSMTVHMPPLRNRVTDIPFFLESMIQRALRDPFHRELIAEIQTSMEGKSSGLKEVSSEKINIALGSHLSTSDKTLTIYLPEPAMTLLMEHVWPGNFRELSMIAHNLVTFTLIQAIETVQESGRLESLRLQVDPSWLHHTLMTRIPLSLVGSPTVSGSHDTNHSQNFTVTLSRSDTLNGVSRNIEGQLYRTLFIRCRGHFDRMADILLGDPGEERKVRLRFNQLGLKVREMRREFS